MAERKPAIFDSGQAVFRLFCDKRRLMAKDRRRVPRAQGRTGVVVSLLARMDAIKRLLAIVLVSMPQMSFMKTIACWCGVNRARTGTFVENLCS